VRLIRRLEATVAEVEHPVGDRSRLGFVGHQHHRMVVEVAQQ
jgi:hypothetical protein